MSPFHLDLGLGGGKVDQVLVRPLLRGFVGGDDVGAVIAVVALVAGVAHLPGAQILLCHLEGFDRDTAFVAQLGPDEDQEDEPHPDRR